MVMKCMGEARQCDGESARRTKQPSLRKTRPPVSNARQSQMVATVVLCRCVSGSLGVCG